MDMRRNCQYYEYKSSFWPLPGIIMVMVIVVCASNYNYNFCGANQEFKLYILGCTPETITIILVASISDHSNC